ncbi:hypothetical protein PG987_008795 [Apiospora arundinis]
MMACLGKCFGKSSSESPPPILSNKSHPGAQRLNLRLRANLNMPPPPTPRAVRSPSTDKPLPPLPPQHEDDDADTIELQHHKHQERPLGRVTSTSTTKSTTKKLAPIALPWETSRLAKHELTDMYNEVHRTMGHIPYVVCGVGALIDHGFQGRTANKVTIIVPEESRGVVRAWAAASGSHDVGAGSDSVGVRMPDGSLRRVRVRWVSGNAFAKLDIKQSSVSDARILGLASQVDQISTAWLQYRERLACPALTTQRERERLEREMRTMVGDIFWCLRRASETNTKLRPEHMRLFLSQKVWTPFTEEHENARFEIQRAGIDVAAVLKDQRQRTEIRAHNALLREFGVDDGMGSDIVTEQPGPFEGMRGLGRENVKHDGLLSVYTVATTNSDLALSSAPSNPPPPMPQPPAAAVQKSTDILRGSSRRVRDLPAPSRSRNDTGRQQQHGIRPAPGRMSLDERGEGNSRRGGELGRSSTTSKKPEKEVRPEKPSRHQTRHSVDMVSGRNTPENWL